MPAIQNLVGQKFNMLSVVSLFSVDEKSQKRYLCLCDCGNEKVILGRNLKNQNTKSCGCLQKDFVSTINYKTGMGKSKLAKVWQRMKQCCYNKENENYKYYGAKGIELCDSWLNFENFLDDMLPTYKEGLSIDRYDVDGNYCPENCTWVERSWQGFNTTLRSTNSSGKTGVHWCKRNLVWKATITKDRKNISLGSFTNFEDAVAAREAAELKYFGRLKGN